MKKLLSLTVLAGTFFIFVPAMVVGASMLFDPSGLAWLQGGLCKQERCASRLQDARQWLL